MKKQQEIKLVLIFTDVITFLRLEVKKIVITHHHFIKISSSQIVLREYGYLWISSKNGTG
jgi:hypothetical protein